MNKERLLNVAKALRECKKPGKFSMRRFVNFCGTPACALGQYAARRDLQDVFYIGRPNGTGDWMLLTSTDDVSVLATILDHFEIDYCQQNELFSAHGCGDASTPTEAAAYIEDFVRRHEDDNENFCGYSL